MLGGQRETRQTGERVSTRPGKRGKLGKKTGKGKDGLGPGMGWWGGSPPKPFVLGEFREFWVFFFLGTFGVDFWGVYIRIRYKQVVISEGNGAECL